MDGTFWSLFVEGGKLKAKMGTDSYSNIGRVFWWPNDVVFGKGDSLTLEYEGFEMSGYHTGNWDCMVQVTPIDAPMDQIHTIPEIYVRTQSRGDTAILVIDAQGNGDRIASQMYPVSDGIHTYKLELNNVGGEYQLGALQFYRDGVLEASSDNVTAYLDELNAVRFYMLNADPEGIKIHTWDNMRIEITKQNSAPLLADFQVSVSADEGEVITNSSQ
jgi:hypothetical protein